MHTDSSMPQTAEADAATAARPLPLVTMRTYLAASTLLALGILAAAAIEPALAVAGAGGVLFFAAYFYRRDWLLGGIFVLLLVQNLAVLKLSPINESLASAVKRADDVLIVFFALALAAETVVPRLRLAEIPLWRPFALLLVVCLLSAAANRLSTRELGIGAYVLVKNFTWFFLASSVRLDEEGYRRVFRFLFLVLGGILAFAFVQLVTGDLTYRLLGLPKDVRLGITRLRAIFIHPVYLAESMALLAVLAVCAYIHMRNTNYLLLAAGALAAVLLTMLVKTILSLGFVVGFLFLRKRPLWLFPYAFGALAAMIVFAEYGTENMQFQYKIYIESPRSVRREGYRIAGEILRDSPLVGVGPGGFGGFAAYALDSPVPVQYGFINYDQQDYTTIDAHWPHLAAEIGLLGLLAYGLMLGSAGRASWRLAARRDVSPHRATLAMAAAVFLLVVAIEAFAAANLEDTLCGFMVFALLGLTQATARVENAARPARNRDTATPGTNA